MLEKKSLRREILAALRALPPGELRAASAKIRARLALSLGELPPGTRVMSYAAMPAEIDLDPLFDDFPHLHWFLPAPRENRIEARRHTGPLFLGPWKTRDPAPDAEIAAPETLDLILVPGTGFSTADGMRLGRGAGHYDRFFPQAKPSRRIGVCLDLQTRPAIPSQPHDLPVEELVTESGWRVF